MNGQMVQVKGSGSNWIQILPPNPRRTTLVLSGNATSSCEYWLGSAPPASNVGIHLEYYSNSSILRREDIGALIEQALYGQTGATTYLTVIEGFE